MGFLIAFQAGSSINLQKTRTDIKLKKGTALSGFLYDLSQSVSRRMEPVYTIQHCVEDQQSASTEFDPRFAATKVLEASEDFDECRAHFLAQSMQVSTEFAKSQVVTSNVLLSGVDSVVQESAESVIEQSYFVVPKINVEDPAARERLFHAIDLQALARYENAARRSGAML